MGMMKDLLIEKLETLARQTGIEYWTLYNGYVEFSNTSTGVFEDFKRETIRGLKKRK